MVSYHSSEIKILVTVLLGFRGYSVSKIEQNCTVWEITIEASNKTFICSGCGRTYHTYYDKKERKWRHLPIFKQPVAIHYSLHRIKCHDCGGLRVERLPWADKGCRHTRHFIDIFNYLSKWIPLTKLAKYFGITWDTAADIKKTHHFNS